MSKQRNKFQLDQEWMLVPKTSLHCWLRWPKVPEEKVTVNISSEPMEGVSFPKNRGFLWSGKQDGVFSRRWSEKEKNACLAMSQTSENPSGDIPAPAQDHSQKERRSGCAWVHGSTHPGCAAAGSPCIQTFPWSFLVLPSVLPPVLPPVLPSARVWFKRVNFQTLPVILELLAQAHLKASC